MKICWNKQRRDVYEIITVNSNLTNKEEMCVPNHTWFAPKTLQKSSVYQRTNSMCWCCTT